MCPTIITWIDETKKYETAIKSTIRLSSIHKLESVHHRQNTFISFVPNDILCVPIQIYHGIVKYETNWHGSDNWPRQDI